MPDSETTIEFQSNLGAFVLTVSHDMFINDLYKLAFRALSGRHNVFQLAHDGSRVIQPSAATISSLELATKVSVVIRITDELDVGALTPTASGSLALIKIYHSSGPLAVAYWIDRSTPVTMESIIWKYWRSQFDIHHYHHIHNYQPWMSMHDNGDGMRTGQPCEDLKTRLSTYLGRHFCSGILGDETVFINPLDWCQHLVLKLQMNHFPCRKSKRSILSRLDVLKQMFELFINRILAYGRKTHVGLITFSSEATVQTPITHVIENFRKATNGLSAKGNTALFDALALARDQLPEYGKKYPDAKKRIIRISDGVDTSSVTNTAPGVAWRILQDHIVVDNICLGNEDNAVPRAISHSLGSCKFEPKTLLNALSMCELEPFLSLTDQPPITPPVDHCQPQHAFNSCLGAGLNVPTQPGSTSMSSQNARIIQASMTASSPWMLLLAVQMAKYPPTTEVPALTCAFRDS